MCFKKHLPTLLKTKHSEDEIISATCVELLDYHQGKHRGDGSLKSEKIYQLSNINWFLTSAGKGNVFNLILSNRLLS